jgi:hypothetical protein
VNAAGWSRGLEVTGGAGVMPHAGLVLLPELADRTGPRAGLSAALPSPAGAMTGAGSSPTWRARLRRSQGDQRFPGDGRPAEAVRPGRVGSRPRGGR